MVGIMENVWKWLGVSDVTEEEIIELPLPDDKKIDRKGNLISLQTAKAIKVMVCEPTGFEEAQAVADNLKNRRQVILNLEQTPPDVSQRIIDFVSGTTYALDGHTQKLGEHIFLFAPSNVEISKDPRMVLRSSYIYTRGGSEE
ncbi:MAG: cell division protein SepF [Acidobacteriota bacterium]